MRGLSTFNPGYYSIQHGFILEIEECILFCADKAAQPTEDTVTHMISAACYIRGISSDLHARLICNKQLYAGLLEHIEEAVLKISRHSEDTQYELFGKGFKYVYTESEFNNNVYVI